MNEADKAYAERRSTPREPVEIDQDARTNALVNVASGILVAVMAVLCTAAWVMYA